MEGYGGGVVYCLWHWL